MAWRSLGPDLEREECCSVPEGEWRVNNAKDEEMRVSISTGALLELLLKTVLICVFYLLPVAALYLAQDSLISMFGPPSPTSEPYLAIVGLLVIWYLPGSILLLPRLGRRIENYVRPRYSLGEHNR